jgi:hypothetical protein
MNEHHRVMYAIAMVEDITKKKAGRKKAGKKNYAGIKKG